MADQRPNVLLILADDLGYSDVGCFGSEIETPNIDRLASEGLLFSRFRATPMCVTSRIALMAGMPMHRAGQHSYRNSIPLAKLLKTAGYRTMMTGKWHAGSPDPRAPELFDRSFGFLGGATDSFVGGDDWFLDDKPFVDFGTGFYSTRAFADRSIEFMKQAVTAQQPFMMYVAFNAPHHPCQASQPTVQKYVETYQRGYQVLRRERLQKQIALGIIPADGTIAPSDQEVRRWDELTAHRQSVEAQRMAAYAAAVDEVDQNIGRLLDYLRDAGLAENTLVVFMSDNGGDYSNGSIETDELQIPWKPGANPSSSNGWAAVKCTPFRYYKHACHEGGIATPMVIRWPAGISQKPGTKIDVATSITDIYPTLTQLAGIDHPSEFEGRRRRPPTGQSLLPLLTGGVPRAAQPLFQWYRFSRGWIDDEWKAVSLYDGPWQLFNLRADRSEAFDLAADHPVRLKQMVADWHAFAAESGVPEPNRAVSAEQHRWGWHRLQMACPSLTKTNPVNGSVTDATVVQLRLSFDAAIDFAGTSGKRIALYDVSDESRPVWFSDPDESHPAQGGQSIVFDNLPELLPGHHYAVRWDDGWIKLGGRGVGSLNDGAFWWRFRTPLEAR